MESATLETSETFGKVMAALAVAQSSFPPIEKNRTAYVRSEKGNYQFDYADLSAVLSTVIPVLSRAGIALLQPVVNTGDQVSVQTWLVHGESGEWIRSKPLSLAGGREVKQLGIATTYLRRYQVGALLGLAPEDDVDDGEETGPREERRQAPAPQKAAPQRDRAPEAGQPPPATDQRSAGEAIAEGRRAITEKAWPRVFAAIQALPPGPDRQTLQQEYESARYPKTQEARQ